MMRKLAIIAITGLIGSAIFLVAGLSLADKSQMPASLWGSTISARELANSEKAQITLPFTATDSLTINVPAIVHYAPGDKAQAIISGDPALVNHVQIKDGRLSLDSDPGPIVFHLDINLTGPAITTWTLLGSEQLTLSNIEQPKLKLNIRGSGSVNASGHVDHIDMDISGSGAGRLKNLIAQTARIDIRGSGNTQITAKTDADVSISGSGNAELFGNPVLRRSNIRGSGRIQTMP